MGAAEYGVGAGVAYLARTQAWGLMRTHLLRNPLTTDFGLKTLLAKGSINLLGQSFTNYFSGDALTKIDVLGLTADLVLTNGASALVGGVGEYKTSSFIFEPNQPDIGIGKAVAAYSFGLLGKRLTGLSAANGFTNLIEGTLKLYNELVDKVVIEGAMENRPKRRK